MSKHFQMINVSNKQSTQRIAIAQGEINVGKQAFHLIKNRELPKGDALMLAEVAGITSAKRAYDLIPLCHPLGLEHVSIEHELLPDSHSIRVYCRAETFAKTGVEMEALAGVNGALLTVYDLTKMIEPALNISQVKLLIKAGGKHGLWQHPDGVPEYLQAELAVLQQQADKLNKKYLANTDVVIITVSDRASNGKYDDESGPNLHKALTALGANIVAQEIVADEETILADCITGIQKNLKPRLIITTGGTGIAPRDITPEVFHKVCDRLIPGLGELIRHDSARFYTNFSWLSRALAGSIGETLLIALPGRPKAVVESVDIIKHLLPHAFTMLAAGNHDD